MSGSEVVLNVRTNEK